MKILESLFAGFLLVIASIAAIVIHKGQELCYSNFSVYKENIPLEVNVEAETNNQWFHFTRYRREIQELVKTAIGEFSCEEVINNPQKIAEKVKSRFNKPKATLDFLTISITPPRELIEASKDQKVRSITVQTDHLLSVSAKQDAVGYTPEAERLEERRDRRFNEREKLKSNERIKMRQAEAIENAADNMGIFSGDLSVEIH